MKFIKQTHLESHDCKNKPIILSSTDDEDVITLSSDEEPQKSKKQANFFCDICHRAFCQKSWIARHVMTHVNKKCRRGRTYQCKFCCYKFNDLESFKNHEKIHLKK